MENFAPSSSHFLVLFLAIILLIAIKVIEVIIRVLAQAFQYFIILCVFASIVYYIFFSPKVPDSIEKTMLENRGIQTLVPDNSKQYGVDSILLKTHPDSLRQPARSVPLKKNQY